MCSNGALCYCHHYRLVSSPVILLSNVVNFFEFKLRKDGNVLGGLHNCDTRLSSTLEIFEGCCSMRIENWIRTTPPETMSPAALSPRRDMKREAKRQLLLSTRAGLPISGTRLQVPSRGYPEVAHGRFGSTVCKRVEK